MNTGKKFSLDLSKSTDELKKLIAEHPDYPIVVLAGEESNSGGWYWTYCSYISFSVGEILDCEVPYAEHIETDRDNFDEQIEEWLWSKLTDYGANPMPEDEFQKKLADCKNDFEPYWKKVIAINATN